MSGETNLGEQALDKAAELAITSQIDEAEHLDVSVQTDPVKLVQGKVDSVTIVGEGMILKQDLRAEAVGINTSAVAVNPLKAIMGEIELTQPTSAQVQVLLTEADINRALSSDYLRNKMTQLDLEVQGKPLVAHIGQAQVQLSGDGVLMLELCFVMPETNELRSFSATTKPSLQDNGQRIGLQILSAETEGLELDFVTALLESVINLLDLRNFDLDGATIQLKDLDIQAGKMLLRGSALVEKIPT